MNGLLRFATGHLISAVVLVLLIAVLVLVVLVLVVLVLLIVLILVVLILVIHSCFLHFICTADAPHVYCAPNFRIYPWL